MDIFVNSQENICVGVFFLNFIKKDTLAQMFSCEFPKFLRTPFLQNTSNQRLLLFSQPFDRNIKKIRKKKVVRKT